MDKKSRSASPKLDTSNYQFEPNDTKSLDRFPTVSEIRMQANLGPDRQFADDRSVLDRLDALKVRGITRASAAL